MCRDSFCLSSCRIEDLLSLDPSVSYELARELLRVVLVTVDDTPGLHQTERNTGCPSAVRLRALRLRLDLGSAFANATARRLHLVASAVGRSLDLRRCAAAGALVLVARVGNLVGRLACATRDVIDSTLHT